MKKTAARNFIKCSKKGWKTIEKCAWTEVFEITRELAYAGKEITRISPLAKAAIINFFDKRSGVSLDYVRDFTYCYGNYILRAVAHRDKCLQMINVFLKTGLPSKSVSRELLLNMDQIKNNNGLKQFIKEFSDDPMLSQITESANQLKHRFRSSTVKRIADIVWSIHSIRKDWTQEDTIKHHDEAVSLVEQYIVKVYDINDKLVRLLKG